MKAALSSRLLSAWYRDAAWLKGLVPLEWLYQSLVAARARAYATGRKPVWRAPVPVIVVGNITLGGTGKSPLVAWLARWLVERGLRPGILSRGYGGRSEAYPLRVSPDTPVAECGDEPLMLAGQTGVPVVVDPLRPRGARRLLEEGCDILISDDGLQHLALGRDIELVVVDGERGFGNARCLPAGPLREPMSRLAGCDALIVNGRPRRAIPQPHYEMRLEPRYWRRLDDDSRVSIDTHPLTGRVHAVAGIGNPERFFATLADLGLEVEPHPFADHHDYKAGDLAFGDDRPVVMTAKDAVKCRSFADARCWALDVEACPGREFIDWLERRLECLMEVSSNTKIPE
ncbi:tetraacyldisaccharide 4'-kinase [Litchfieldella qijiaojingensis]|uniref:Tetraacyldisaccharide 4'-kinase n=1 Tax=Litchfieldella qijiaojingensis TaxID=980347 RepID=A0ABQ2YGG8_9GAMM|nr:tetraacyldisaccharide 4'-kinase [Halomonas qijiaojingensis]GGX81440.1 tetraacyldisaccharide 4'-kinase [Halomonas qijiaojingensis]